jgi:hypothetical protein
MIERFDPDYMNYGVEVNESWASPTNPDFVEFLEFAETVYTALKEKHPDLPIFVSLSRSSLTMSEEQIEINKKLLQFSDYVTVSTYPFVYSEYAPDVADPADLPASWFSDMADLAPDKPFAIAETSYIAEDLVVDGYDLTIKGDAAHQADYVEFLLEEMHHLDAEFVVWFVPRDYDQGWKRYGHVLPSWSKTWRDCGLFDGRGNPRPALGVWNAWLAIPGE